MSAKPLTGRKVLMITLGAFGVIFAANMALVYSAIGSFPGLEIKNTYVASQKFDTEKAGQVRLGWVLDTDYVDGALQLSITDAAGNPALIETLNATVGRATHANADVTLDFVQTQSPYSINIPLDAGKWEVRLNATANDGTPFRQRLAIIVKP
jgi:nitrogen fixation protein FixH